MAITRITDVIPVKLFTDLLAAKLVENSRFRQSGVVGVDPRITAKAQAAGLEVTLREWIRPAGGEATSSSDVETSLLVADKVSQAAKIARMISRNRAFSAMDIADYASDSDAIEYVINEFARLRLADEESAILAILEGICADSVANDGSDLVKAQHITTGTIVAADNLVGPKTLLTGRKTMGDMGDQLDTIVMHSDVVNNLRLADVGFKPASETSIGLATYMGYKVIETDKVGKAGAGNYPIYTSYIMGSGALVYANAPAEFALEQTRNPLAGDGSGASSIINRYRFLMHPAGYTNQAAPANTVSQTNAELAAAATWNRVDDRKAVPIVKITTNG